MTLDKILHVITCHTVVRDSRTDAILEEGYIDPYNNKTGKMQLQRIEPLAQGELLIVVSKE